MACGCCSINKSAYENFLKPPAGGFFMPLFADECLCGVVHIGFRGGAPKVKVCLFGATIAPVCRRGLGESFFAGGKNQTVRGWRGCVYCCCARVKKLSRRFPGRDTKTFPSAVCSSLKYFRRRACLFLRAAHIVRGPKPSQEEKSLFEREPQNKYFPARGLI